MQYLTTKLVPILKVGKWYKGHYCILHRIWNTESRFKYYFNVKFIEVINYCGYVRVSLLENTLQYFSVKGQNVCDFTLNYSGEVCMCVCVCVWLCVCVCVWWWVVRFFLDENRTVSKFLYLVFSVCCCC